MKLLQLIAALAIALCPFSARADLFNFSYTFGSGDVASGSLTGTQSGIFVESVSNVSVFLNGNALAGNPNLYQPWGGIIGCCWSLSVTPVISFDGNLNSFIFADAPPYDSAQTNFFSFSSIPGDPWQITAISVPLHPYVTDVSFNDVGYVQPDGHQENAFDASRWSLTVAAVPEPETYALMLAGLGLLGFAARRRKLKEAAAA